MSAKLLKSIPTYGRMRNDNRAWIPYRAHRTVLDDGELTDMVIKCRGEEIEFSLEFANFDGNPPLYNIVKLLSEEGYIEIFSNGVDLPVDLITPANHGATADRECRCEAARQTNRRRKTPKRQLPAIVPLRRIQWRNNCSRPENWLIESQITFHRRRPRIGPRDRSP